MQLVIPIEDTCSGSNAINHCVERKQEELEVGNRAASAIVERNGGSDALLSAELRDQFETMKTIWRQARREQEDERSSSSTSDMETRHRRVRAREDLKRKERETAVETAIKVQNEIETWQNGIADLEALLAAEEEQESDEEGGDGPPGVREIAFLRRDYDGHRDNHPQIQFPFLPPAVPTEDETDEAEDLVTMSTTSSSRI